MHETKSSYTLRLFKNSSEPGFADILGIYAKFTNPALRTNSNEITYWLDQYNQRFEDRLYIFGFYVGEAPAGYAQLTYFTQERFAIIDYLTLHDNYLKNNVFFECMEHIKWFVERERLEINFLLFEVGCAGDTKEPSESGRLLIRLLKLHGFKVIRAPYFQPLLHKYNPESAIRAILLMWSNSPVEQIKRETYIQTIKTLYYRHYLRWHQIYSDEVESYSHELDKLNSAVEEELKKAKWVKINGHRSTLNAETATILPEKGNFIFAIAAASILFVVLATFLLLQVGDQLKAPTTTLAAIYILILASFFGILSLFRKRAFRIFEKLLEMVKTFFDKK